MNSVKASVNQLLYRICQFLYRSTSELNITKLDDPISCMRLLRLYSEMLGIVIISA